MKKILVLTDFSEVSTNAAHYATHLAEVMDMEVVFFHAGHSGEEKRRQFMAGLEGNSDVLVRTDLIVSSQPLNIEEIRRVVNHYHIRFIVMGTVGSEPIPTKRLFGTNTEMVIRQAPCPVLIVPPDVNFRWISKVALASDLDKLEQEVGLLIPFIRTFNAELDVFLTAPEFPGLGNTGRINLKGRVEPIKRALQYANIGHYVEEMPVDNEINEGINRFITQKNADLLVVFHRRRVSLERVFSSGRANRVGQHLKFPILVYPPA